MGEKFHYLIEPVAKQMCILAGLDPEMLVYVPRSSTETRVTKLQMGQHTFQRRSFYAMPASIQYNDMKLERVEMPFTKVYIDDERGEMPVPTWMVFREAAYDAILAHYAVRHVLLAGKEVEL